jgi:DNA-binding GntR family transcriptional regulator
MSKGLDPNAIFPAIGLDNETKIHNQVYTALANALMQGKIPPLKSVSLRALANALNVSPMPVREAVHRLIAEKALELQPSNKRLRVPQLDFERLEQLTVARLWVEPELAKRAAGRSTRATITRLRDDDANLMHALENGDVAAYMQANQDFHFTIYGAADADLFYDMARTLWLQAGPFMRVVFGKLGTVHLPKDHHQDLIVALENGDAQAADIHEGMALMVTALSQGDELTAPKRRKGLAQA